MKFKELKPLKEKEIENLIEIPRSSGLGDYAFPCFALSKKLKKSPNEIAKKLNLFSSEELEKILDGKNVDYVSMGISGLQKLLFLLDF